MNAKTLTLALALLLCSACGISTSPTGTVWGTPGYLETYNRGVAVQASVLQQHASR